MIVTPSNTLAAEFRRWAELARVNDMGSHAMLEAMTGFDVIRADTAPEVLDFAESLRGQDIEASLLAGLLIIQAAIWEGR